MSLVQLLVALLLQLDQIHLSCYTRNISSLQYAGVGSIFSKAMHWASMASMIMLHCRWGFWISQQMITVNGPALDVNPLAWPLTWWFLLTKCLQVHPQSLQHLPEKLFCRLLEGCFLAAKTESLVGAGEQHAYTLYPYFMLVQTVICILPLAQWEAVKY